MTDLKKGIEALKTEDYKTALQILPPFAEKGDGQAQFALGIMYYKGFGVPQNYIRAHMWLNLGQSNGHKHGLEVRAEIERKMTPQQIERAQDLAVEQFEKTPADLSM